MSQENRLEKTNRINLLFAFYELLLTEKQQTFLKYYFHDDFSLGEIAAEFEISRQAVYEHIKRAEQVLENTKEASWACWKSMNGVIAILKICKMHWNAQASPLITNKQIHDIVAQLSE